MSKTATANWPGSCANCGTPLAGDWCHACGQKRLNDGDRRFGHLLGQFVASLTDLDSRLWRSLRALLFRPGRLSLDYLEGRRQRWMTPASLFLLANLLYFLSPGISDFELPFANQLPGRLAVQLAEQGEPLAPEERARRERENGQLHSRFSAAWVEARVAERDAAARADGRPVGYTLRDYALAYDARSADISKLLIILHVPFLALALQLLAWRRRRYFAEHFVVGLHLFTFLILFVELGIPLEWLLGGLDLHGAVVNWILLGFLGLLLAYVGLALRRVYALAWWWTLPAAAGVVLALAVSHIVVYRTLQFLLIFAVT